MGNIAKQLEVFESHLLVKLTLENLIVNRARFDLTNIAMPAILAVFL
jgi:hypothetical protein